MGNKPCKLSGTFFNCKMCIRDRCTGNGVGLIRQNGVLDAAAVQLRERFTHPGIRLGKIGEIAEVRGAVVIAYRGLKCGNLIGRAAAELQQLMVKLRDKKVRSV